MDLGKVHAEEHGGNDSAANRAMQTLRGMMLWPVMVGDPVASRTRRRPNCVPAVRQQCREERKHGAHAGRSLRRAKNSSEPCLRMERRLRRGREADQRGSGRTPKRERLLELGPVRPNEKWGTYSRRKTKRHSSKRSPSPNEIAPTIRALPSPNSRTKYATYYAAISTFTIDDCHATFLRPMH